MHWSVIIWVVLYCVFGWLLSDMVEDGNDVSKMTIFITWPLIIGIFVIASVTLIFLGVVYGVIAFIYGETTVGTTKEENDEDDTR